MKRRRRRGYGRLQVWDLILWSGALLVLLPVLAVATSWWRPVDPAVTTHLRETLLGEYIGGSLALLMGVLLVAGSLGVSLAWMVARYRFPGDRLLAIALWLPLTVPGYVLAFVYSGLLEYSGPVATALRARGLNFDTDIRNFTGAVLVLSFALYPYVYLIMRTAFQSQGARFLEAGQSLGRDGPGLFFRLILPLSRPWLLTSLALVGMETMADFGAVSILGYDTFTTGIYKAWYGFFSPVTAARLASLLVVFVLTILLLEQWAERRKAFHQRPETALLPRRRPAPLRGWLMTAWGVLIVSLGFLVPLVQLLLWSVDSLQDYGWPAWLGPALGSSVVLGVLVGLAVVAGSFFLTMGERLSRVPPLVRRIPARLAMMGYALPGAVLAVGLYQAAGWFDQLRLAFIPDDQQTESWLLTGSVVLLVGGLALRFMAVGGAAVGSAARRLSPHLEEAAAGLGAGAGTILGCIHAPLLRPAMIAGFVLACGDALKEMPLTLMTRPFGWDTLSVKVFEFTSEGDWQQAAVPGLTLMLTGLVIGLVFRRGLEQ